MEDPYRAGAYAPIDAEIDVPLSVEGEMPRDVLGTFVRNGPNLKYEPVGRHHWFDGDGMLHAVTAEDGQLRYRNRWVRTAGLKADEEAGRALWRGLMEPVTDNPPHAPYKDTGNTDVLAHNGELLTLHYLSGAAHRVDPRTLQTLGVQHFGKERPARLSAHAKVDQRAGELLFFDYGPRPPFMRYGVVDASGQLTHLTAIDLPGPRLPHDMAFTENHAILMDLPVWFRPEAVKAKKWMVDFHRDVPARFGVLPRRGDGADIRWFEAEPCYVYHSVNAWEEDGAIVMLGCRCDEPIGQPDPRDGNLAQAMATLRLRATWHRWRFDLSTGETTETRLDDVDAEFPTMDARRGGRRSRFSYHMRIPDTRTLLFDGIIKYDTEGAAKTLSFGDGVYGSEAPFAPRVGGEGEDDGFLMTFVHDTREDRSALWVVDAKEMQVVARAPIPQRVPLGFHATWAEGLGVSGGAS